MINIEIQVAWWRDWREVKPDALVPVGTMVRQSASGHLIRRVVMPTPSVHSIVLRRAGLNEYLAGLAAAGKPKTLVAAVLHHIDETAENHPPVEAWTDMVVDIRGDAPLSTTLTAQLKTYYGLPKAATPAPEET